MTETAAALNRRKLVDRLGAHEVDGPVEGFVATTYEFNADFFDTDFLPALLGIGAIADHSLAGRLALERKLAELDAAVVFVDVRGYHGRPRSLRIVLTPVELPPPSSLHAKVLLVVHTHAVRLFIGSANLTPQGYRENREVMTTIHASERDPAAAALIRATLPGLASHLGKAWNPSAQRVVDAAMERVSQWAGAVASPPDTVVAWTAPDEPLWSQVVERWPAGEHIDAVQIVSPFWSDETADGPLTDLVGALAARGVLSTSTQMTLYTEARPHGAGFVPLLHESIGRKSAADLGIGSFGAVPVDPAPTAIELGGRADVIAARCLHAKVVKIDGPTSSVCYVGSGNFTRRGWGFQRGANLEAGLLVVRTGAARAALDGLVPSGGTRIELGPDAVVIDPKSADEAEEALPIWPSFIGALELVIDESSPSAFALEVEFRSPPPADASFLARDDDQERVLVVPPESGTHRVALGVAAFQLLRRTQAVEVRWSTHAVLVPINLSLAARDHFPLTDGGALPEESAILAYYLGRIDWETAIAGPLEAGIHGFGAVRPDDVVDTSRIQSYRIREFVESLPGLKRELLGVARRRGAMTQALRGPISPLALGKEVIKVARAGERTPTGAAFQLVELLTVLESVASAAEPQDAAAWAAAREPVVREISTWLAEVTAMAPTLLGSGSAFERYRVAVTAAAVGAP